MNETALSGSRGTRPSEFTNLPMVDLQSILGIEVILFDPLHEAKIEIDEALPSLDLSKHRIKIGIETTVEEPRTSTTVLQ